MTRARIAPFFLAIVMVAIGSNGCFLDPNTEWFVTVTTDAPVPTWVNRALIEVTNDDGTPACDDCTRELDITPASFPITFGSAGRSTVTTQSVHVRARLFDANEADASGRPPTTSLIDAMGLMPLLQQNTSSLFNPKTPVFLPVFSGCFGKPVVFGATTNQSCTFGYDTQEIDLHSEQELLGNDPYGLQVGVPFVTVPEDGCGNDIPANKVCVSGDFLLGDARYLGVDTDYPPVPVLPQFVNAPILIDMDEMTVGTVRKLIASGKLGASGIQKNGDAGVSNACTYLGPTNAANDALPINCIDRDTAFVVCTALNALLPFEEQWEHAARGSAQSRYPWGDDPPTCNQAIVSADATCARKGPVAGGSPLDVTKSGIRNMGGNLAEWVSDPLVPYSDKCWKDGNCPVAYPNWQGPWVYRGGSWNRSASSAATFARFASRDGLGTDKIGFRCVSLAISQ